MGPLTSGEPCPQHLCKAGSVLGNFKHGLLLICCLCPWHPGFQRAPLQSPAVFSEGQGLAFLSPRDEEMFLKSAWRFPTENTGVSLPSPKHLDREFGGLTVALGSLPKSPSSLELSVFTACVVPYCRTHPQPGLGAGILSPVSHLDCVNVRHCPRVGVSHEGWGRPRLGCLSLERLPICP